MPSVAYGALGQTHIRQDHANQQFRIDGVPIPEGVSSTFTDVISPRMWERADIILGGMEAQYGNKTALLVDITSKSGTRPSFGSAQMFGGSNETVNPSFEYGGTVGEKVRFYVLNSYTIDRIGASSRRRSAIRSFTIRASAIRPICEGDYQHDNRNSVSWVFLNAVAKYQIPTIPGLAVNPDVLPLLQAQDPTFSPVASQAVNQNQKENSQYTHLVWRHDVNAEQFFPARRLSPEFVCELHDRPVQHAGLCTRSADGQSEAQGLLTRDAARLYVDSQHTTSREDGVSVPVHERAESIPVV